MNLLEVCMIVSQYENLEVFNIDEENFLIKDSLDNIYYHMMFVDNHLYLHRHYTVYDNVVFMFMNDTLYGYVESKTLIDVLNNLKSNKIKEYSLKRIVDQYFNYMKNDKYNTYIYEDSQLDHYRSFYVKDNFDYYLFDIDERQRINIAIRPEIAKGVNYILSLEKSL